MHINLVVCDLVRVLGSEASSWYGVIILYLGPETMMPIASALAGIIGAIIMFWQRLVRWARRFVRFLRTRTHKPAKDRKSV